MKILLIIILLLFSCKTPEKYQVTGFIKEIDDSNGTLLIDHNEIPGFMVNMVMYFNLEQSVDINQFSNNFFKTLILKIFYRIGEDFLIKTIESPLFNRITAFYYFF